MRTDEARRMSLLIDTAGWAGAAMLIVAYSLVSWERVAARSRAFQWLNIAGSILILANSLYYQALPSAATNLFLIFVGIAGPSMRGRLRSAPVPSGSSNGDR